MPYQVLADDGTPLDADFDVDGNTIVFHSRGGTRGRDAVNLDYSRALRLIVHRLREAGYPVQRVWVDSSRVRSIPISDRVILDAKDATATPSAQVSLMATRMQAIGRQATAKSRHGNSTKRIRLQLAADILSHGILSIIKSVPAKRRVKGPDRLRVFDLERVSPEHLFNAVQRLLSGYSDHEFWESKDYDVLLESGVRMAPKAIFGLAASEALGYSVVPRHFTAGLDSKCFRILKAAGYTIVPKGEAAAIQPESESPDPEWVEGSPKLRKHLRRERSSGLRQAKKAEFRRRHGGQMFCERCGDDPVEKYGTQDAEACIEVHHAKVQISEMQGKHRTRLEDLQCLCANCHRLAHREMSRTQRGSFRKRRDRR